jgi:hypothetical protein
VADDVCCARDASTVTGRHLPSDRRAAKQYVVSIPHGG